MQKSIVDIAEGTALKYPDSLVYAPGGAFTFSELASAAKGAASAGYKAVKGAAAAAAPVVKRGVISAGQAGIGAAKVVGKAGLTAATAVGTAGGLATAYMVDTKLQEWRKSKGLPLSGPFVFYSPAEQRPQPAQIPDLTGSGDRVTGTFGGNVVDAPYPMVCMNDRVAFGIGSKVLQSGQYYICPLCGKNLLVGG